MTLLESCSGNVSQPKFQKMGCLKIKCQNF